jgi:hypothetical protein
MLIICPIFDRIELLDKFIRHYQNLCNGDATFAFIIWNGSKNRIYRELQYRWRMDGRFYVLSGAVCRIDEYNANLEAREVNKVRVRFKNKFKWMCVADLDEFIHLNGESLLTVCSRADNGGFDAIAGSFLDRFPIEALHGQFINVDPEATLDEQFPLSVSNFTTSCGACGVKTSIFKSSLSVGIGHHYVPGSKSLVDCYRVHHFKWTNGVHERLKSRYRRFKKQGLSWSGESKAFLDLISNPDFLNEFRVERAPKLAI